MFECLDFFPVSYPPTAPETVSRKLADFAFMLRDYRTAAAVYDSIRKDYLQDGAQKLFASATVSIVPSMWHRSCAQLMIFDTCRKCFVCRL